MILIDDINKIAMELRTRYPDPIPASNYDWRNPSLNIIDCVLSLNRNYTKVVKPRVIKFKTKNPDCFSIEDLLKVFQKYDNKFDEFTITELNYNHADRGRIIFDVSQFLLQEISNDTVGDQLQKLETWAKKTRPENAYSVGIKGFGLSGFQYLRMLFGAQTTKPDVHIRNFLSKILNKNIADIQALNILEKAALQIELPLRDLDYEIWKSQSGSE